MKDRAGRRMICNLSAALPGADEISTADHHSGYGQVMVCYKNLGLSVLISQDLKF